METEKKYQLERLYTKYKDKSSKRKIKEIFNTAWDLFSNVSTIIQASELGIKAYIDAKNECKKKKI